MSVGVRILVKDSAGISFDPASCAHQFSHDANANVLTDTCFEQGAIVRVKTFTYNEIGAVWVVATETQWINVTDSWQG
jgi:hypothetical protein